jgi:zinc protease
MLEQFKDAQGNKITNDEFDGAKRMCITTHELHLQRPADQAGEMALDELYGLGYDFGDSYADRINAVKKEDLRRVAQKYFTHHVVAVTTPEGQKGRD